MPVRRTAPAAATPQQANWIQYQDTLQRPYYYNVITKETVWAKPDGPIVGPDGVPIPSSEPAAQPATTASAVPSTTTASAAPQQAVSATLQAGTGISVQSLATTLPSTHSTASGAGPGPAYQPTSSQPSTQAAASGGFAFSAEDPFNAAAAAGPTPLPSADTGPVKDEIGGTRNICTLRKAPTGGAGIKFIYDRKGWWVYNVLATPGQPDIKQGDLIVGINSNSISGLVQEQQVVIIKENFNDGAQIEVRRGLQLPPGHMDANGNWIPAPTMQMNMGGEMQQAYQKYVPGLGNRWVTKYLFFREMSPETDWYTLKHFVDEVDGAETVLTTVMQTKDTRPGAGKKKMMSACQAIVEFKTPEIAEKVLLEQQGKELDLVPAKIDFSNRPGPRNQGYGGRGRYGRGDGGSAMMKTDQDKIDMVEDVTASIVKKLKTECRSPYGITQHWIGMFLAREFGCGILRKLVFLEPMAYYTHRPEFEVVACSGVPLGKNDKVQAFKIKLTDEYGGRELAERARMGRGRGRGRGFRGGGWDDQRAGGSLSQLIGAPRGRGMGMGGGGNFNRHPNQGGGGGGAPVDLS